MPWSKRPTGIIDGGIDGTDGTIGAPTAIIIGTGGTGGTDGIIGIRGAVTTTGRIKQARQIAFVRAEDERHRKLAVNSSPQS
jgi:hypothetical protein